MAFRIVFILGFFISAGAAQSVVYVPQFAHGGGANLNITTTITLVNLGDEVLNPARATVEAFGGDGAPANLLRFANAFGPDEAVSMIDAEIEGRGTAVVESLADGATAAPATGYVKITTEGNLAVEVIFSIFSNGALLTTTSILPAAPADSATLLVNVDASDAVASSVAVVNSATQDAVIDATVFDDFGIEVGSGSFSLAPGERVARNWAELINALAGRENFNGTVEVTVNQPVAMLPLRQDGVQLTTQAVLPAR